jgi:hypothetical protein
VGSWSMKGWVARTDERCKHTSYIESVKLHTARRPNTLSTLGSDVVTLRCG